MEKKKLKKLTINKMNEFPVIGEQEQLEIIGGGNPGWWTNLLSLLGLGGDDNSTTNQNHYGSGDNVGGSQINFPLSHITIGGTSVPADTLSNHGVSITGQDSIKYDGQQYMIYGDSVVIKPN